MSACHLPERGPFDFGAPYGTTGIRLTNVDDGPVLPTGYAYWAAINAHTGQPALRAFVGTDRARGGQGPSLYTVDTSTLAVTPLGPLFPPDHALSWATGEGWYWSATDASILYVSDDEHLYRLNVDTHALTTVVDLTPFRWMGRYALRQWHTSHDGRVHSATVKAVVDDGAWPNIGTLVYREADCHPWAGAWVPKHGDLDESQIDPSGAWVLVKEDLDGLDSEDNRMIRVADGIERTLMDRDGAAGHSDCGYGYMVAADNWHPAPAAWRLWMFDDALDPQGRLVYSSPWETQVQHVSHCNARPGSPDEQWVLGSGAARSGSAAGNELIVIPLDGSMQGRAIAPTLVDLDAPGGGTDDYNKLPRCNLDPTGEFALWTSNHGSDRLDAFLVKVPAPERSP